jgi:hypothetical protein
MPERDDKLPWWQRLMSAKAVAQYMRNEGRDIGSEYSTHGDVWDEKDEVVQTGLMHLILDQLQRLNANKDEWYDQHRRWLRDHYDEAQRLVMEHAQHKSRLVALCGAEVYRSSDLRSNSIHWMAETYYRGWSEYKELRDLVKERVDSMKKVRKVEDVGILYGIGKKTAAKIIEAAKAKTN